MVILEIHSKSLKTRFKTTFFSKATLFIFVTTLVSVIFPFLFVYRSRGFWLKHDTFYEQPNVKFKASYLFYGLTNNNNEPIICNNFPHFQQYNILDACNTVKVREIDANFDGKPDEINFNLTVDLATNIKLQAIDLLLLLDYKLQTICPTQLETAAIIQQMLPSYVTKLDVIATLDVSQSFPLSCTKSDEYANGKIIKSERDEASYVFQNVLESYLQRNLTTPLSNVYMTVSTTSSTSFILNLKIKYPVHKIYYKTGFWQLVKWAWIQYFPVYFLCIYIIKRIRNYVFENRLVLYYEESPLKKSS